MRWGPAGQGERGETLVETLVTTILLGTAIVALIGGITAAIGASDNNKDTITAQVVVGNYAEAIIAAPYQECTDGYAASEVAYVPPSGYTPTNPTVTFYDGASSNPAAFGAAPSGCAGSPAKDNGAQRLTLRVAAPNSRTVRTLEIVKRR